jgi:superkiller protein 3
MTKLRSLTPLVLALVFVAMAFPVAAQNKKQREQAKKLMEAADRSFAAKSYADAADQYGQSLSLVATNPIGHYRKGFAHFELTQYDQALTEFAAALSQGFRPPVEIYRVRTYIYLQQKNWDAALADAQAGRQLMPRDAEFAKAMVEAYLGKGDTASALDLLKKAAVIAPNDAEVDYYLARTYSQTGDFKGQQAAAESALKKGTRMISESYILLALACDRQHNWPCSIDAYTRAMAAKPGTLETYRNLAEAYRSDARYGDAIAVTKKAIATLPQNADLYADLSWFQSLNDDPVAAINAAKTAIGLAPTAYLAYTNLCRAYNDNKQYDLSISACNRALQLQPGDGETYFYLGRALNLTGKNVEATKMYSLAVNGLETYVAKLPDYSDGYYLLGNAYFADNQRDKAAEAYLRSLAISPKYAKARYNLGIIYTRKKMKPAAQEQYAALQKLDAKLAELLKAEIDKM